MGVKHRKRGLSPGSAYHINYPHLPIRPAHAPQPWQEGLGLQKSWSRKEGLTPCPHFFLCREALKPQPWYSSPLGYTKPYSHLTGLSSLQEVQTLSPSIAQALTSMGWTLLPSRQYLTRRTSVQSSTTAFPLRSTSPLFCLPSWKW